MEKKILRLSFSKPGGTASKGANLSAKLSIPNAWLKEMGIDTENREVEVIFINNQIIIKKMEA